MNDTLKSYIDKASAWVAANPADVVYAALIVVAFTLVSSGGRRR